VPRVVQPDPRQAEILHLLLEPVGERLGVILASKFISHEITILLVRAPAASFSAACRGL
jgi:hypothetical protein